MIFERQDICNSIASLDLNIRVSPIIRVATLRSCFWCLVWMIGFVCERNDKWNNTSSFNNNRSQHLGLHKNGD